MQINSFKDSYTPQFKAIKVANTQNTVNGITTNIEILKLGKEDNFFLKKLLERVSLKTLFPKLNSLLQDRWQKVFEYCITQAIEDSDKAYIALCDKKPCGIMTYQYNGNNIYLDGLCSIPIIKDKKVPYVGSTLMYQLFKDANDESIKNITLSAVQDGPFDVVEKYENFGFKKDITSYPYVKMKCNKYEIAKQYKNLHNRIEYDECTPTEINLEELPD